MSDKNVETNKFSNYDISIRIGDSVKFIDLDVFAVLCDRFLYEELIDIITQCPTDKIVYSGVRNKIRFYLQIFPKQNECPVS